MWARSRFGDPRPRQPIAISRHVGTSPSDCLGRLFPCRDRAGRRRQARALLRSRLAPSRTPRSYASSAPTRSINSRAGMANESSAAASPGRARRCRGPGQREERLDDPPHSPGRPKQHHRQRRGVDESTAACRRSSRIPRPRCEIGPTPTVQCPRPVTSAGR